MDALDRQTFDPGRWHEKHQPYVPHAILVRFTTIGLEKGSTTQPSHVHQPRMSKGPKLTDEQQQELMKHVREAYKHKRNNEVKKMRATNWVTTCGIIIGLIVYQLIRRSVAE